jgi:hypothetical protein
MMRTRVTPHEQVDALTGAVEDLAGQFSLQPLLQRILRRPVILLGGGAGIRGYGVLAIIRSASTGFGSVLSSGGFGPDAPACRSGID